MLKNKELYRYHRHIILPEVGVEGQEKLKAARVLVVGAGGLGCPVLLYLTSAGVGEIGVVDFDMVDESNLHRQILYSQRDIGKSKAEVSVSKLIQQNPLIKIRAYHTRLDQKKAIELFSDYDIIIDGTDNFSSRYLINDACVLMQKPFIYGAIHKFEGQVSVFNWCSPSGKLGPSYRCLFPNPPTPGSVFSCSETGVLGVLPGIIGTLQATEAIKMITGIGELLSGKLLLFNALKMQSSTLEFHRQELALNLMPQTLDDFLSTDYTALCSEKIANTMIKTLSLSDIHLMMRIKNIRFLDVREPFEQPEIDALRDLKIPLVNLLKQAHLIPQDIPVVVFCKSGQRSQSAIEMLQETYKFTNLYHLDGGITAWLSELETA